MWLRLGIGLGSRHGRVQVHVNVALAPTIPSPTQVGMIYLTARIDIVDVDDDRFGSWDETILKLKHKTNRKLIGG